MMRIFRFLIIILIGIFPTYSLYSQPKKGDFFTGGETKLKLKLIDNKWKADYGEGDKTKTFLIDISPQLGYFLCDNLAVGLELPLRYSSLKSEDEGIYDVISKSIAVSVLAKYYYGTSRIKPFLYGTVGYGGAKAEIKSNSSPYYYSSDKRSSNIFLYKMGGGIALFINETVSMEIFLNQKYESAKYKDGSNTHIVKSRGVGIGLTFLL